MKPVTVSFAVGALMAMGLAAAQTSTSPSSPSAYPPSSSSSTTTNSTTTTTTESSKSHKQQMKDCMASEQANHPSESKSDAKKTCKSQMENSPHQ